MPRRVSRPRPRPPARAHRRRGGLAAGPLLLLLLATLTMLAAACTDAGDAGNEGASQPAGDEPIASTAAIPTAQLPVVEFIRADGTTAKLPVEVPRRREYSIGLSGRRQLEGRGMLFYYPRGEGNVGFWMKNTHVDLSIAFLDTQGRIIEVSEMQAESLDIIRPSTPYEFGVEAPAGWYDRNRVRAGDRMRLTFDLPRDILD
ncbi:MAG: DUF192 domain-containing protein [Chloroflexi bacterium]|nr:DUF192 domain-containing protein [Chloroflexota bacterium]